MQEQSIADVEALVSYITPTGRKPFSYEFDPPAGVPRRSASYREYPVRIRNARSLERQPTLDEQGFALRQHATRVADFYDEAEVKSIYYAEVKAAGEGRHRRQLRGGLRSYGAREFRIEPLRNPDP